MATGHDAITIGLASWLAKKNGLQGVAIFAFENGRIKAVSYGADRHKCRQLGRFIDYACGALESGEVPLTTFEHHPELF